VASPSPRPRGRPRKDTTLPAPSDTVFSAVLHAFAIHGFQGVSMRTLNRELGVSHNLLHKRFGSKDNMWHAAVDWGFGNLVNTLIAGDDEDQPPLERLRQFIRTFVAFSAQHPDLLRLINIEAGEESERLDYLREKFINPVRTKLFEPLYTELVASGRIRAVPLQTLYFMITSGGAAMFSSEALARALFTDTAFTPAQIEQHANSTADLIINGLLATPPASSQ